MKLIVCDIDGTLINSPSQKLPSERLIKVIQDIKENYLVTCATGRSRSWAKPVLEAAAFTAPAVLGGGTHIVNPQSQQLIWEQPLLPYALEGLKAILKEQTDLRVLFNDYTEEEYLNGGWGLENLLSANEVFLMEVVAIDEERANTLIQSLQSLLGVTAIKMRSFHPNTVDIHILHELATKEHAIEWLQETLGITKVDTIGIGDGHNDFHIFKAAGTKVAVSNAVPELKELADEIIGSVTDDAVAEYLEKLGRAQHEKSATIP